MVLTRSDNLRISASAFRISAAWTLSSPSIRPSVRRISYSVFINDSFVRTAGADFCTPAALQGLDDHSLCRVTPFGVAQLSEGDRKSTRLNSSHLVISYAVFCLKKKKHPHEKPQHYTHDTSV